MTALISSDTQSDRLLTWKKSTWEEYVRVRDRYEGSSLPRVKLFFHEGALLVDDMGWEGIDHAIVRGLFSYIFLYWFSARSQQAISLDGCLLEKEGLDAGSPDLVVYLGDDYPRRIGGGSRKVDLNKWRSPDLVSEVSDTTLASDLDEKKKLYAAMEIKEYWVIDVQGDRVILFHLNKFGQYEEVRDSVVLPGLSGSLLTATLSKVEAIGNMGAANWFQQQIASVDS